MRTYVTESRYELDAAALVGMDHPDILLPRSEFQKDNTRKHCTEKIIRLPLYTRPS